MLGRVLKEVKLPLPADFFPEMEVSGEQQHACHLSAFQLLHQALRDEHPHTRAHPAQRPDQWKLVGDRQGLQLYRERGAAHGSAVKMIALGTLAGSLEEVMWGLYAATTLQMKTQRSIMHSDFLDAAVLHSLEQDAYAEGDAAFSYHFSGFKWMANGSSSSLKIGSKSDLCWHEEMGLINDEAGQEVGYLVIRSVDLAECPLFVHQGLKRSMASVCYIFRDLPNGSVGVYMKGEHAVGGKTRTWSSDPAMVDMWLSIASAIECAQAKRLSKLVCRVDRYRPAQSSKICEICDQKVKPLKTGNGCKICGKNVCDRCGITKTIYPNKEHTGAFPCSAYFCKRCLIDTKDQLYAKASRVSSSDHSSSNLSGSHRSVSPRQPLRRGSVQNVMHRMPQMQQQQMYGASISSASTRTTQASEAESEVFYYSDSHLRVQSPRSSNASTARLTNMSAPPSFSSQSQSNLRARTDSISNKQFSRSASATNGQWTQVKLQAEAEATAREANRRHPSRSVAAMPNGGVHQRQNVSSSDSSSGYSDNDSDSGSDSDSDLSDIEDESHRATRPRPISEEAEECAIIEIPRTKRVQPDPVFQRDNLKYINSFRSERAGSVSSQPPPSQAELSGKALMDRLIQCNLAAEATYLITKHNAHLQQDSSLHANGP